METTLCELRKKEVINIVDGRRLGRIIDIVIDLKCGKLCGIIVPGKCGGFLSRQEQLYIEWKDVCKIGDDVIIVELKVFCDSHNHHGRQTRGGGEHMPVLYDKSNCNDDH